MINQLRANYERLMEPMPGITIGTEIICEKKEKGHYNDLCRCAITAIMACNNVVLFEVSGGKLAGDLTIDNVQYLRREKKFYAFCTSPKGRPHHVAINLAFC